MLDHLNPPVRGADVSATKRSGRRLSRSPKKASLVEYGLLIAAIVAVLVLVFFALGNYVTSAFHPVCDPLTPAGTVSSTSCSTR